jgi:hypothetical protein
MTATDVAAESVPVSATVRGVWRSTRGVLLVAVLVVLAAVLPLLLVGAPTPAARLDPRSTALEGSAALHALLRDNGVDVILVDDVADVAGLAGPGTRVLVSRPDILTRDEARGLGAVDVHLLVVGVAHADLFLGGSDVRPAPAVSLRPGCTLPAAVRAGSAYLGGASFQPDAGTSGCYRIGRRPTLVTGPGTTVVASGDFMTNRRLDEDGNAALALNLAGADPRLVWLLPPDPVTAASPPPRGGQSPTGLMPPQVPWAAGALVLAVVLAALWRGRRLGPVVVEPLPVVVRAAETVEGRGRLYRARRARPQAARALRSAAVARIATRLGLPVTATPGQVTSALVGRFGQDAQQVERLLYGPAPEDDPGLVRLADELDVLERRVREQ